MVKHGFNLDRLDLDNAVVEAARGKAEGTSFRWIHLPLNDIDFVEASWKYRGRPRPVSRVELTRASSSLTGLCRKASG